MSLTGRALVHRAKAAILETGNRHCREDGAGSSGWHGEKESILNSGDLPGAGWYPQPVRIRLTPKTDPGRSQESEGPMVAAKRPITVERRGPGCFTLRNEGKNGGD